MILFYKSLFTSEVKNLNQRELFYRKLLYQSFGNLISTAVPSIDDVFDTKSLSNLEDFFIWNSKKNMKTDWMISLSLIIYLDEKKLLNKDLEEKLVLLACSQWTYSDKTSNTKIMIISSRVRDKNFYAEKSFEANKKRRLYYTKLCNAAPSSERFVISEFK